MDTNTNKQVAIIGAGISGLLACKYTLSKGLRPVVFESRGGVGGVWTKTVEMTRLQTPKPAYQFSDFPWPAEVAGDYPDKHQVYDYVQSYARHFDLLKHIKFNARVLSVEFDGPTDEDMRSWTLWGGNGEAFGSDKARGKWKLLVVEEDSDSGNINQVRLIFNYFDYQWIYNMDCRCLFFLITN